MKKIREILGITIMAVCVLLLLVFARARNILRGHTAVFLFLVLGAVFLLFLGFLLFLSGRRMDGDEK